MTATTMCQVLRLGTKPASPWLLFQMYCATGVRCMTKDVEDETITKYFKIAIYMLSILSQKAPNPKCGQIRNTAGPRY